MSASTRPTQTALTDYHHTTQRLLDDITSVATTHSEDTPPVPTTYAQHGNYDLLEVYRHWATWRDAIHAAGFDPDALPSPRSDMDAVDLFDQLIHRIKDATTIRDWSMLLKDHLRFGNTKMNDSIAIFNIGTATDCPNRNTDRCQVPDGACYAVRDEHLFPHTLHFRRRQAYLWDALDPDTFAQAFLALVDRKRNPVEYLRINESGDLRHQSDVVRLNRVADILADHGITVYTYTASSFIDLPPADDRAFVVNASNPDVENADQRFIVVDDEDAIPDDGFRCPYPEEGVTCGDCRACLHHGGTSDIYEVLRDRKHA